MKTALIVDDSRLARTVLSRLLAEHGVAADEVPSAEAALDYLKERRPDVVFLDHMMPGMDGFEALEAIKANPITATIPVMMYTSQEGRLYLGQARALGALGVLPKSLQPVEVTNVLRSLRLIPGDKPRSASGAVRAQPKADGQRIKELIEELFYEQANVLREEIRKELRRSTLLAPASGSASGQSPLQSPEGRSRTKQRFGLRAFRIASVLLLALAVVLGHLYYETSALLNEANSETRRLAAGAAALTSAASLAVDSVTERGADDEALLGALEWAANRGNRYAFGAVPLDDERAVELAALFDQLGRIGFNGTVAIDVHVGRHCMNYGSDGSLELAPPEQPAAACEQFGWTESEALEIGARQSVGFANLVADATRSGALRVETVSRGSAEPAVEYPVLGFEVTAGEWNALAANNQRIVVRLLHDAGPTLVDGPGP